MTRKGERYSTDLFAALAHPLRRRILRAMMNEDAHTTATPSKLAASLDESINEVSYHVRALRDCKVVRLVKTSRVRGADQHFYRCSLRVGWARAALEATNY
jgi:DNA-binding transcriptional ArsR family regulator